MHGKAKNTNPVHFQGYGETIRLQSVPTKKGPIKICMTLGRGRVDRGVRVNYRNVYYVYIYTYIYSYTYTHLNAQKMQEIFSEKMNKKYTPRETYVRPSQTERSQWPYSRTQNYVRT